MPVIRQILWKVLVVGMVPFILGAGLPQMDCRCAAAKGQRWCECCFRKPTESPPVKSSRKSCCQRQLASQNEAASQRKVGEQGQAPGCPTCHQFANPKTGSCCSLKQAEAPTLSKLADVPDLNVALLWLPLLPNESPVPVTSKARHELLSRACQMPSLDRVIVFEHLLI
jgi:hypothetical protein